MKVNVHAVNFNIDRKLVDFIDERMTKLEKYYDKQKERTFIKENLSIAKSSIIDNEKIMLLIVRKNKVVWANDLSYKNFPVLLEDRNIDRINLNKINEKNT